MTAIRGEGGERKTHGAGEGERKEEGGERRFSRRRNVWRKKTAHFKATVSGFYREGLSATHRRRKDCKIAS